MGFFDKIFSKKNDEKDDVFYGEVEETPFIAPYDFFIEADERFDDVETVETWELGNIDAVAVLEQMNLCDDVKNHSGVRRKISKVLGKAAFEIDGYESYNDGRNAESSLIEKIDERELEISVHISRNSDDKPFEVSFGVKQV